MVVVRDPATRRRVGEIYREAYRDVAPESGQRAPVDRLHSEAEYLAEHLEDAPVLIVACLDLRAASSPDPAARYASIIPALQNLCLAARAAGLGTVLTTVARRREDDLHIALGIPSEVEVVALVPLGWPARPFGTPRRRQLSEITFLDRWGIPWAAADRRPAPTTPAG